MMEINFVTFYLQYVHQFKFWDQGLYLHSRQTRPCLIQWKPQRKWKQTKSVSGLLASTTERAGSKQGVRYSVQMAQTNKNPKLQDVCEKSFCRNFPTGFMIYPRRVNIL